MRDGEAVSRRVHTPEIARSNRAPATILVLALAACAGSSKLDALNAASVGMEQVQLVAVERADSEADLDRVERLGACWRLAYALACEAMAIACKAQPQDGDAAMCAGGATP